MWWLRDPYVKIKQTGSSVGDTDLFAVTDLRCELYHERFGVPVNEEFVVVPERLEICSGRC